MDYRQEQADEVEALRAIFDDVEISENEPRTITFNISGEVNVSLQLQITYVDKYPEEVPKVEILGSSGFSEEDMTSLKDKLSQQATENLGMPMVFALQASAKDVVDEKCTILLQQAEELRRKQEEEANLAEVERNLVGTLVTSESFAAWNAAFMREVEAARESYLAAERALKKGRLTGRQLFERDSSLRTSDIKEVGADEVAVDTSVFANMDPDDLEDVAEDVGAHAADLFAGETFSDEDFS